MNTHISLNRLAGCLLMIIVGTSSAGAIETSSPIPSPVSDLELPTVPVLTTPAGVLPTSPLAFFDRFDEFVGRTFFTFGIPSLRTQALVHQAAERIAELQVVDAQGLRTRAMSVRNLKEFSDLLDRAVRISLERIVQEGRLGNDLQLAVRTIIAGDDAILSMSEDTVDAEETAPLAEDNNSPLSPERRLIQTLREYEKRIPAAVLQETTLELFAAATRRTIAETTIRASRSPASSRDRDLLQRKIDAHLQTVRSHLAAGRLHDALPVLHDLTILQESLLANRVETEYRETMMNEVYP